MSKVYPLAKVQKPVVGQGVTDLWMIQVNAYGKPVKNAGWQAWVSVNEYVSATLGTLIGLPIPPFAMLEKQTAGKRESLWFASLSYTKEGENLPPIFPRVVFSLLPDICYGVIVFDLWIANTDRYERNLSFDPSVSPKRLNVFDHSHALFGLEGEARLKRLVEQFTLTELAESGANRHCLMDQVTDFNGFGFWVNRITQVPQFQIVDACKNAEALGLIDASERQSLLDFLLRRRRILRDLLDKNCKQFTSLTGLPITT